MLEGLLLIFFLKLNLHYKEDPLKIFYKTVKVQIRYKYYVQFWATEWSLVDWQMAAILCMKNFMICILYFVSVCTIMNSWYVKQDIYIMIFFFWNKSVNA